MSRYTVERSDSRGWRYVMDGAQPVGVAMWRKSDGRWTAGLAGGKTFLRTFPTPEAVAAAWDEITGDHK